MRQVQPVYLSTFLPYDLTGREVRDCSVLTPLLLQFHLQLQPFSLLLSLSLSLTLSLSLYLSLSLSISLSLSASSTPVSVRDGANGGVRADAPLFTRHINR